MKAEDPYDLQRFIGAQDAGGTYEHAVAELRGGRKSSHWMWFVFPQIAGLGYSPASRTYAITSLAQAQAYLAHPVLGARLVECAAILTGVLGRTAEQIFGEVDAMKLRSSMTLFMHAAPGEPVFRQVLDQYFDGIPDSATEQRILNPRPRLNYPKRHFFIRNYNRLFRFGSHEMSEVPVRVGLEKVLEGRPGNGRRRSAPATADRGR